MRVLIAGAGGMLGSDAVEAVAARGHEAIGLGHAELDITRAADVDHVLAEVRPDAVINCAAWTDVDGAEADEPGAMRVNDAGAALLASAAGAHNASVLYVSSDYVFDGSKRTPYVESDLTGAISAYGRSKQGGETSVAIANHRHFIVRSSWLFGAGGPNFIETMLRLAGEQPEVIVVTDQVGCPTYTRHLAQALALVIESEDYGIHHIAAAGKCSWYEFAQEIFDQADVECRVMAGTTEMLARPAKRPALSALTSERDDPIVLPDWRQGLAEYLAERRARLADHRNTPGREAEDVVR
jgi:dTDP-4-dehydrorhamnose reductase